MSGFAIGFTNKELLQGGLLMAKTIFSIRVPALPPPQPTPRKSLVQGHSLIRKMQAFDSWKSLLQAMQGTV